MGFESSKADLTLYLLKSRTEFVYLIIYDDDILTICSMQTMRDMVFANFKKSLEVRVSKRVNGFFGVSIKDNRSSIALHNEPMIEQMLRYINMDDCKIVSTTLPSGLDQST